MPQSSPPGIRSHNLYVHVPFCARKCDYCAFYSEASDGDVIRRYVSALVRELQSVAHEVRPETVFFGGGTPSLLTLSQWEMIFGAMDRLRLLGAGEWTVECNPATVSLDKARLLRDHGVNRVSMGVQSLDEALLDRLGRVHTREMVFKSFDILRQAGFENLNVDLMFAIPGQTMDAWKRTLDEAIALGSEHLSCYEVIFEDDTPLYAQLEAGEFDTDEDLACAMHEELIDRAAKAGLVQYEIANFAKRRKGQVSSGEQEFHISGSPLAARHLQPATPSFACRHNINYWRGGPFHGLGPSATSYLDGIRTKNWPNTALYCELIEGGRSPVESRDVLGSLARAGETAAFGLRMVAGWPFDDFRRVTGFDLRETWATEMDRLIDRGWGRTTSEGFHLTREGLRFADAAAELFLK